MNCFSVNATGGINCMDPSERDLAEENWRKNSSHKGSSVLNPDCEYGSGRRVEIEKLSMLKSSNIMRCCRPPPNMEEGRLRRKRSSTATLPGENRMSMIKCPEFFLYDQWTGEVEEVNDEKGSIGEYYFEEFN